MSTNYKTCPFCGKELWGIFGPHPDTEMYFFEHETDECSDIYISADSKEKAIEWWNTRENNE